MSTTDAKTGTSNGTFGERFSTYLEAIKNPSDIALLVRSFDLSLRAANRSPKTIKSYTETVRGFCMFLVDSRLPTDVRNLTRSMSRPTFQVRSSAIGQRRLQSDSVTFNSSSNGRRRA